MPIRVLVLLALVAAPVLAAPAEEPVPPAASQPQVDDPMLAPPQPAPMQVGTWQQALGFVRERSTDLRTAQANVDRAEGRWRQALSALLPNLRFSASVAVDALHPDTPALASGGALPTAAVDGKSPTAPLGAGTVALSQSLLDVGAWRGKSSAAAAQESAESSLRDVQRRLTLGVARTLVATVSAERVAEINRVGLRQALERAALTQRSFELGASNQLDVVRVNQDVAVARESLVSGDEQLRRAREALGLALGFDGAVGVSPSLRLQGLVDDTRNVCAPLDNLGERADLVAARSNVESAREPPPGVRGLPAHGGPVEQPQRLHHRARPRALLHLEHRGRAVRAHLGGRRPAGSGDGAARRRAAGRGGPGAHAAGRGGGGGARPARGGGGPVAGEDGVGVPVAGGADGPAHAARLRGGTRQQPGAGAERGGLAPGAARAGGA